MHAGRTYSCVVALREIPDPAGIRQAKTLPASAYSSGGFHEREREAVFQRDWVCAASSTRCQPLVRSQRGSPAVSRCCSCATRVASCEHFSMCAVIVRHPCVKTASAHSSSLIRCPYHSWLYQLDGSLARASGVGDPEGFDVADYSLKPVRLAEWRRMVFICFDDSAEPLDVGPLGRCDRGLSAGVDGAGAVGDQRSAVQLEGAARELLARTTTRRSFIPSSIPVRARTIR